MAVSLKARISLVDKFSAPMRQIERQVERNQRALDNMRRKANQTGTAMDKMARSGSHASTSMNGLGRGTFSLIGGLGSLVSSLNPVALGFAGLAAGATAAYGAVKIFNATVGEAMKMQQSKVMITSMFGDKKKSEDYMKMMDKYAINSPLFDSQQMYGNSKSFITASKDVKQLEKMWSLAERLTASDPAQGLEGAVFALRELFAGDTISLQRRFEMDGNVLADIKNLPLEKQLVLMDKYFNKMGLTTKLIDDMGGTALGMWSQVKERFQLVLRDMGEPSLKAVSKFLGGLLDRLQGEDMKKFGEWGGKVIESMVSGLSSRAIRLYDWFSGLTNDPEFKKLTTISGKVDFIVADIGDKLNGWLESGGRDKLVGFGETITGIMVGALNQSGPFLDLGYKLGQTLWEGVQAGIENSAKETSLGKFLTGPFITSPALKKYNEVNAASEKTEGETNRNHSSFGKPKDRSQTGLQFLKEKFSGSKSHSAGLDRVPYNGYQPTLHKDEKILNAQEAREYRNGGKGSGISIGQLIIQGNGDMKSQAREFLDEIARLIETEGGQMV